MYSYCEPQTIKKGDFIPPTFYWLQQDIKVLKEN